MKIFSIAYYTAIKNLKDTKTLLFVVVLPILLIIILGTALDGFHSPQDLPREEVAYFIDDNGEAAQQFAQFLQSDLGEVAHVQRVAGFEEGLAYLDSGQADSFVYLPAGFGAALSSGEAAEIQVLANVQNPLAKSLVENYINRVNGALAVTVLGGVPAQGEWSSHVRAQAITTDGQIPTALDYYAVQTLLQVLIIGALFGIAAMREDNDKNTLIRIKSAPVKYYEILAGRTMANIGVLFAQALVVIAFSKFVYQANWGGNQLINLGVILIFVVFSIGVGMFLGAVIKNSVGAIGALWGVMIVFAITGGAFGGTVNDTLAKLSPNHYAATAIFNNVFAGSPQVIRSNIIVLLLSTVAVYALTLAVGRRRLA
ncbi:ABC transporter permease [Dethiobacter alkaliphilus]|uniref:ABC transporter permease n=1 Tax=Dethiobacter alkaliphilus TaxID=427926 RepID=UPI0022263A57|nr:ABC transporter permease [Dethiobacter alkaliphilus]MCW3489519.1 ABC transporter permease [Dethiobacter alkaliphilus]